MALIGQNRLKFDQEPRNEEVTQNFQWNWSISLWVIEPQNSEAEEWNKLAKQ